MYRVQIEQFEGPLDLLLELIEAKKLPLVEISLAKIADQFINYLESLDNRDLQEITQFLVVASRLLLLKSRELVPSAPEDENDGGEGDIAALERQLRLYQIFRRSAKLLRGRERDDFRFYGREAFLEFESIFYFPKGLETNTLQAALKELLGGLTLPQRIPQAQVKKMVSLERCLAELTKICAKHKRLDFSEFLEKRQAEERLVHFLGALELLRLGKVNAEQERNFGTIILAAL